MNWWPSFKPDYPAANLDANGLPKAPAELFADCTNPVATAGTWYKLVQFTRPAERALLADSRQFYLEARMVAAGATIPGQRLMFANNDYSSGTVGASQTMYDFYRHGVNPPVADNTQTTGYFSPTGGKIGYNILYADGHVSSPTDREEGYRACRMRYPTNLFHSSVPPCDLLNLIATNALHSIAVPFRSMGVSPMSCRQNMGETPMLRAKENRSSAG